MGRKPIYHKLIAGIICTTFLYSCSNNPQTNTNSQTSKAGQVNVATVWDKDIGAFTGGMVSYDNDVYYSDWKSLNPNYIELNGARRNEST